MVRIFSSAQGYYEERPVLTKLQAGLSGTSLGRLMQLFQLSAQVHNMQGLVSTALV